MKGGVFILTFVELRLYIEDFGHAITLNPHTSSMREHHLNPVQVSE